MTDLRTDPLPAPLKWARGLLLLLAAAHLAIPVVMWSETATLVEQTSRQHPEYPSSVVSGIVAEVIAAGVAFHTVLAAVAGGLAVLLPRLRRRGRRFLVASQVISTAAGAVSWSTSPLFHTVIPAITAIELVLIILVTVPQSTRAHFASIRHNQSR